MYDFQKLVDALSSAARSDRSQYHVTLGELIDALNSCPPQLIVRVDRGGYPCSPRSYRGYYSDLAFETTQVARAVEQVRQDCTHALGNTYEGYKGGDFVMEGDTPLWVSDYGRASGVAIVKVRIEDDQVILQTKIVN